VSWLQCFLREEAQVKDFSLHRIWRVRQDPNAIGVKELWMQADVDEKSKEWSDMRVPARWGDIYPDWYKYKGDVWFKLRFNAPEIYKKEPLEFFADTINDTDEVWLNGQKIGETTKSTKEWWAVQKHYRIPDGLLKFDNENVLTIRINDNNTDAGFISKLCLTVPLIDRQKVISHYLDARQQRDNPYTYMGW
jgi:hypothetical protein